MSELYYMKITNAGLALLAASLETSVPVDLTNFGVGNSNGVYYEPVATMTELVNELYKTNLNSVYVDPDNAVKLIVEGLIPMDHSGQYASDFTIMEVGIYADDGDGNDVLFALGKTPAIVKPLIADGSGLDTYIRMHLVHTNVSQVTLQVDSTVVMATQAYVDEEVKKIKITDDVSFHSSVNTGQPVYYNGSTNQYELAIADGTIAQEVEGIANVELDFVVAFGQFVGIGSILDGEIYYLSSSVAGELVTTPPSNYIVQLGKGLPDDILHVNIQQFSYREKRLTIKDASQSHIKLFSTTVAAKNQWVITNEGNVAGGRFRIIAQDDEDGTNAAFRMTIEGDTGNVGIGVEAATEKLHVVGNALITGNIESPTIVTPTIASMVNANHNHGDAAGGGILAASAVSGMLGDWTANNPNTPADPLADNTSYYAPTDGFVTAYNTSGAALSAYTDSSSPPTTERTRVHGGTDNPGICMPVKKGHYWKVINSSVRFWIPIGV